MARVKLVLLLSLSVLLLCSAHEEGHHGHEQHDPEHHGHKCVHNKEITPLLREKSKLYETHDFFDVETAEVGTDYARRSRSRRRSLLSQRPFEVHLDYQLDGLAASKQTFLKEKLIPTAQTILKSYISAKTPVTGKLLLSRHCNSYWDVEPYLCFKVSDLGKCLGAQHKATYFGAYKECTSHLENSCTTYPAGEGVTNKDLILYVTAENTNACGNMTIAYAGWCEMDPYTKRPIAGNINFCPNRLDESDAQFGNLLDTSIHEILHVLAFSDSLYQHFISASGQPLGLSNVVKEVGQTKSIVTENVVNAAKQHFNCDTVSGVQLENEGGSSTAHSHWEELHYNGELMVGVQSGRGVLSNLSLALLKDSGWYTVADDSEEGLLQYGHNEGCAFVGGQCAALKTAFPRYHCSSEEKATSQCTADHMAFGYCHDSKLGDTCTTVKSYQNGNCWDSQFHSVEREKFGEVHALNARCFEAPDDVIRVKEGNLVYSSSISGAGCFQTQCANDKLYIGIGGVYKECPEGQYVNYPDFGSQYSSGRIGPCPKKEAICPYLGCPNDCSGNGKCHNQKCHCYLGHTGDDCSAGVGSVAPSPPAPPPTTPSTPSTPSSPTPDAGQPATPTPAPAPEVPTFKHSYRCFDGYLSGCDVYLSNDSLKYLESDLKGTTDLNGQVELSYQYTDDKDESYYDSAYIFLTPSNGCKDTFTGLAPLHVYVSKREAKMVSPLTTLGVFLTTINGLSMTEATSRIFASANVSSTTLDVYNYDPIVDAASENGSKNGFVFTSKLASYISMVSSYYSKEQDTSAASVAQSIALVVSNLMADGHSLTLSDAAIGEETTRVLAGLDDAWTSRTTAKAVADNTKSQGRTAMNQAVKASLQLYDTQTSTTTEEFFEKTVQASVFSMTKMSEEISTMAGQQDSGAYTRLSDYVAGTNWENGELNKGVTVNYDIYDASGNLKSSQEKEKKTVSDLAGILEENLVFIAAGGGALILIILFIVSLRLKKERQMVKDYDDADM
ncbi:leishmanolysin-like peptidase [Chloropicon primus]|uniref:Leishmanolysin-like peptidase n=1 Tax=Chloropicon primus TaxID=1764295 RepID=A0A5B8MQL7_9CHLO|nr:leishmanolysin-like peptidase [Chloropicon primus]|eukprot:QDZ22697.1 leishmanolysin-like peptidase [Chloropicon primus]